MLQLDMLVLYNCADLISSEATLGSIFVLRCMYHSAVLVVDYAMKYEYTDLLLHVLVYVISETQHNYRTVCISL